MIHHLTLLLAGTLLLVVAWATREVRARASAAVRRAAEVAWIVGLTLVLAEGGATLVGLGGDVARGPAEAQLPREPVVLSLGGTGLREDWVRPRTDVPLVAVVGDSFTAGQGVEPADALPDQLRASLAARNVEVDERNDGECGDSFAVEAGRYTSLYATQDPDIVVWVFVLNDFGLRVAYSTDDFIVDRRGAGQTGVRLWDALRQGEQARAITASTELAYHEALRADSPRWATDGATLRALVEERRAAGGRFVFVIYPLLHQLSDYPFVVEHARVAAWARDAGAEVIDLLPVFQGQDATALWASTADHHPNARAHHLAASHIADVLAGGAIPRAGRSRCEVLPAPEGLEALARAACDQRDVGSALALARATASTVPPLTGMMAALAVWRSLGTPEEAVTRTAAARIVGAP